jgi:chromosome segregation ATPase
MRALSALLLVNAARLLRPEVGQSFLGLLARTTPRELKLSNGTEIETTFVRDCQGVVSVQFEEYLPLTAIRAMCEKVDRGTECREHAIKLVNTFRSPERDYATWCREFFSWFKVEHGQLCPDQCNKFMCKPKCEWLEHIAGLDAAEAKLIEQEEVDQQKLREVRSFETELEDLDFEHKQITGKLERSNKWVERAQAKLAEEQKRLESAANATAKAEEEAGARDAATEERTAALTAGQDSKTQLGFALDSERLAAESKEREARRQRQLMKEAEEELLTMLGEAEHAGDKVEALEEKLATEMDAIEKTNETLRSERSKIEEALSSTEAKESSQKQEIDDLRAKVNKTAEDETQIKMKEVLRKETSAKADKLMEDLAKVVKKEKALKDKAFDTKFIRKDLRKAEDDKVDVLAKAEGMNTSLTEAKADAEAAEAAADAAALTVSYSEANISALDKNITEMTEAVQTAKVTADHAHSARTDKQAEEADRAERVAKVHKDLQYDDSENTRFAVEEAKLAEDLDALKTKLADAEHDYSVAKNSTDTAKTALSAERELAEGMDPGPAT